MFANASPSAAPAAAGAGGGGGGAAIQPPPSPFAVSDRGWAFSVKARWVVSFAERAISGSNMVMTNDSTLLGDKMLEMLAVLRMNRAFMGFMRSEYTEQVMKTQQFNMNVIAEGEWEGLRNVKRA